MPRILLVEDNELSRDMLSRRLARRGFEIDEAPDAEQALAMAAVRPPALILMDLALPGLDGLEAVTRLRAASATRAIPVIALSAHALSSDRDRALAVGCDDYDTKPVDLPRLLDKIGALLPQVPRRLELGQARLDDLNLVREFVTHASQAAGGNPDAVWALTLAVDEICSNIVIHGYGKANPGPISLEFEHLGRDARLTISDRGRPFHPADAPIPDLDLPLEKRPVGGLGWEFVGRVVDRLEYIRTDDGWNQVTLIKQLAASEDAAE
jgi:CheY-like chemotaxis protein